MSTASASSRTPYWFASASTGNASNVRCCRRSLVYCATVPVALVITSSAGVEKVMFVSSPAIFEWKRFVHQGRTDCPRCSPGGD